MIRIKYRKLVGYALKNMRKFVALCQDEKLDLNIECKVKYE